MDIIYNDQSFLIAYKPPGVPAQPDPSRDRSLLELAQEAVGQPLFVVHRIDRPVSGLVIFAKTSQAAYTLSIQFQERDIQKYYLAIVPLAENIPPTGILEHFLSANNAQNRTKAFNYPQPGAKKATLSYRVLTHLERYSVLAIDLHSGRHHQIRAQMAAIGLPIKGDVKYGAKRGNPDRSICLHAWKMTLNHPDTGKKMTFVAPLPKTDPIWATLANTLDTE